MIKWTENRLQDLLCTPPLRLIEDVAALDGDFIVLGASGKMGPSLCALLKHAVDAAGTKARVIAAARFTDASSMEQLTAMGINCVQCSFENEAAVGELPAAKNVLFLIGRKFGTFGTEHLTWHTNTYVPALVANRYASSRIVAFSSGNIYPLVPLASGGCDESVPPQPLGEYAMSCLARERVFEHYSFLYGFPLTIYRLNFAVDLRYGVLYDIAEKVSKGEAISLNTPSFNILWQGSANEYAIRCLCHGRAGGRVINVTGPETLSVRKTALRIGQILGKVPVFSGEETGSAYLSDAGLAMHLFGYPQVPADTLIRWQAQWILDGGKGLGKQTHFEVRDGKY